VSPWLLKDPFTVLSRSSFTTAWGCPPPHLVATMPWGYPHVVAVIEVSTFQKAKVSVKKNASGLLFEGYFTQCELWPCFMGCLFSRL